MLKRMREMHVLVAHWVVLPLTCGCCNRAAESSARAPVSATCTPVDEAKVTKPLRAVDRDPCLRLEIAQTEAGRCRRGLCLRVTIRGVGCFEGIWINTTSSFAVPGKIDGLFSLDVREADSDVPAEVMCLIHPSAYEPTPEYVQFRGDTVVERTISETCFQMSPTKSWRVVARYKDNGHGPVTYEPMQRWLTGELVSNEIQIPAKHEETSTP